MTKLNERETYDRLIDLGAATVETKGAVPGNRNDGELPQQFIPTGLSAD